MRQMHLCSILLSVRSTKKGGLFFELTSLSVATNAA